MSTLPANSYKQLIFPTWLFGVATMLHVAVGFSSQSWLRDAIMITSPFIILQPYRFRALTVICIFVILDYFQNYNLDSNSTFLQVMIAVVLFLGLTSAYIDNIGSNGIAENSRDRVTELVLPGLRGLLIVMYFYGILHKINAGWFTPEVSCAVLLWDLLHLPVIDSWAQYAPFQAFLIWSTLIFELIFMIGLLADGKFKYFSMTGGVFFHTLISFSTFRNYWAFSALVFVLYASFLPASFIDRVRIFFSNKRGWEMARSSPLCHLLITFLVITLAAVTVYLAANNRKWVNTTDLMVLWAAFSGGVMFVFAYFGYDPESFKRWGFKSIRFKRIVSRSILVNAVVVFYFVHSAFPYLGLQTVPTLTMFSNLYTEDNQTNHYFIPASWQLFDWQRDIATIEQIDIRRINRNLRRNLNRMPVKDLLKHMRHRPNATATFTHRGIRYEDVRYDDVKALSTLWPKMLDTLFSFKMVDTRSPRRCSG